MFARNGGPPGPPIRRHPYVNKPFLFDLYSCLDAFPKTHTNDDAQLSQAIINRAQALTPTDAEKAALTEFVDKVKAVLEKIKANPDSLPGVIHDFFDVGSFKKDTMLRGNTCADIVVSLRTLPAIEHVTLLAQKICSELNAQGEVVAHVTTEVGCLLTSKGQSIRLLITTESNASALEKDLHLGFEVIAANRAAVLHANFFIDHCRSSSIRLTSSQMLVRVLKDLRRRFPKLKPINIWATEALAFYCLTMTMDGEQLTLGPAFRRFLALLSSGVFIPGSSGLADPIDNRYRLCDRLSFEDMDSACLTAQFLLRILCHGGYEKVLGLNGEADEMLVKHVNLSGVTISPLASAYDKSLFPEEEEKMEEAAAPAPAPTAVAAK